METLHFCVAQLPPTCHSCVPPPQAHERDPPCTHVCSGLTSQVPQPGARRNPTGGCRAQLELEALHGARPESCEAWKRFKLLQA